MNFFDLRNAFISLGLTPNGKYELKDLNEIYPTYSVQGLLKAEYEYNIKDYPNFTMLDIMKYLSENWLPVYKQITGKNFEINSVAGYVKMMSELVNMVQNLKWEVNVTINEADEIIFSPDTSDFICEVDFGNGVIEKTDDVKTTIEHTLAPGDYKIIVRYYPKSADFIDDYIAVLSDTAGTLFVINFNKPESSRINSIKWPIYYTYSLYNGAEGTKYYYTLNGIGNDANEMSYVQANELPNVVIGDSTMPYFAFDAVNLDLFNGSNIIKEITIQVIGADFSEYTSAYPALTTLKVAPDDLKTFKTAVTAFNKGNTTATLTVLKGKNQEEAYQWATANGHFASIVKE